MSVHRRRLQLRVLIPWIPVAILAWLLWRPGATPGYYDDVLVAVELIFVAFALSETGRWLRRRRGRERRAGDRRHGERRQRDDAAGGDAR
jgi:hypothetical protein